MHSRKLLALFLASAPIASWSCRTPSESTLDAGPDCPALSRPSLRGDGCEPILPLEDCPPGQMPVRGHASCQPVGWSTCPSGFEAELTGWGCSEILPDAPCAGATREKLGSRSCQPVGDCTAAFPPPDATLFVDDSYAPGQVDSTHFRSILAALAVAPAGAVIAVEEGSYFESNAIVRPVRIVGRCAAKVTVDGRGRGFTGFWVNAAKDVEVSGLTLTHHTQCIQVSGGGSVVVRDSVLDGNQTLGVYVAQPGSRAALHGSVVRQTRAGASGVAMGVAAEHGGAVEVVDTAVTFNDQAGLGVSDPGSRAVVTNSVVLGTRADQNGKLGRGISAQGGATLEVRGSAVVSNHDHGISLFGWPTEATVSSSVVRGTQAAPPSGSGFGMAVFSGARATVTDSAFVSNALLGLLVSGAAPSGNASASVLNNVVIRDTLPGSIARGGDGLAPQYLGWGIAVEDRGTLEAHGCALVGNREIGLAASQEGSRVSLSSSLISTTAANVDGFFGRGVAAQVGAEVELLGTAVIDSREIGVDVASANSRARVTDCLVRLTRGQVKGELLGVGILARLGGRFDLLRTSIDHTTGVALVISEATGTVSACHVSDNDIGLHVQGGVSLQDADAIPDAVPPLSAIVSSDTRFVANAARLGAGVIPLPATLGAR